MQLLSKYNINFKSDDSEFNLLELFDKLQDEYRAVPIDLLIQKYKIASFLSSDEDQYKYENEYEYQYEEEYENEDEVEDEEDPRHINKGFKSDDGVEICIHYLLKQIYEIKILSSDISYVQLRSIFDSVIKPIAEDLKIEDSEDEDNDGEESEDEDNDDEVSDESKEVTINTTETTIMPKIEFKMTLDTSGKINGYVLTIGLP